MSGQERLKLLNKLCKICSRHHVIPTSMHIPGCSEGSAEVKYGGFANTSRGTYEGRQVAIKIVRAYGMDNVDVIRSVSGLPTTSRTPTQTDCRDSAERESLGNISDIPMCYRRLA